MILALERKKPLPCSLKEKKEKNKRKEAGKEAHVSASLKAGRLVKKHRQLLVILLLPLVLLIWTPKREPQSVFQMASHVLSEVIYYYN